MALYSTFKYGDGTKYGIAFRLPTGVTRLRVYSSAGALECELREWERLDYTIRSNHWGVLTLKVHRSARCLSNLVVGAIVEIARVNKFFYYQISYISPKYDETGHATEYLTAIGRDFNRIPYERIIERPAGEDFHSVTDKVDNCMKDLVRKQLVGGFAADSDRVWPLFSCEGDESEHADTETFKADPKDNLGELLEQIGAAYSVDFWVEPKSPLKYLFRTAYPRRGQDRSSEVVFSIVRHNILGFEHWEDGGEAKTLVYVAGAGEGSNQIIQKYPAAEPTGAARKEAYVAATYIEATAQLEVYGEAFLDTFGQSVTGVSFKFQETDSCKWGVDFDIGDLVTVWDPQFDKTESIKVEEIAVRVDAQGRETLEIRVGKAKPSAWDMLMAQRRLRPQDRLAVEHDHSGDIEGPKIDPSDLDPPVVGVSFAVPTISLSTAAAEGVLDTLVRSDCTIVGFDVTVPNTIEPDDVAITGVINYAARRDHEHAIVCAIAGNIAPDDTAAEGSATSFARSDHAHGFTCATPTDVGSANAEGAGTEFVRDNHVHRGLHSIQKAAAGALYGNVTLSEGANVSLTQAAQDIEIAVTGVSLFAFKTIACPAGTNPVADAADDTLTFIAGANITITGNAAADSITIAASGVLGDIFKTIACPAGTNPVADASDDTLTLTAGTNITITGNAAADSVTIGLTTDRLNSVDGVSNAGGDINLIAGTGIAITPNDGANTITFAVSGVTTDAFKTFICPDSVDNVQADQAHDTFWFSSGTGILITGVAATDTVTIELSEWGFAYKYIATDGATITADQIADTASILGGNAITTSAVMDQITVAFDYPVTSAATPNTVALRSVGGHLDATQYWLSGTNIINVGRNVINMVSCNLVAHGGYGLPWVRVPTSQGVRRLTAVESPVFLFQDVADEIDPLLEEISEGEIWVAPLFKAIDGKTPEWQKLSQREPDKWLVLTQREGYAGIRFQEAPPVSEEKKPETPYWEVEDIKKDQKNCNGCKTIGGI